jgi:outer membrane protein TolC
MQFFILLLPLLGQETFTVKDAVREALAHHPSLDAASARVKAAGSRIDGAKSGMRPRVQYTEGFARSDNPVFVFGSLLNQRQFGAGNFAIDKLNSPDFVNNFQSLVTVDQALYDGRQTRLRVQSAQLGEQMSKEERRVAELSVVANVARAYWTVVLADEGQKAVDLAMQSAEADLKRAETVRAAGMSTDAEVLSVKVHVAAVREQQIRAGQDREVARAVLNEAMGRPLDQPLRIASKLALSGGAEGGVPARPEIAMSRLGVELARTQMRTARTGWLPQVGVRGAVEADRQRFVYRGGANWLVAATLRWNLFDGMQTRAKVNEARFQIANAEAGLRQVTSASELAIRQAQVAVRAATERIAVADAAIAMAVESLRIVQNRYDGGLTTVTELLRNESALLDARTRHLRALYDARIARLQLEFAKGTLQGDSDVLE